MDEQSVSQKPTKELLSRIPRIKGELREVVLSHTQVRTAARLVRVEAGGVDRETGNPLKVYFEVTAKVPWHPEATRTFALEYNARVAYLMAQHGVVDFTTPLGALPPRLWPEPRNLTALSRLERPEVAPRTRMNSGDSDADSPNRRGAAISTLADAREPAAGALALIDSGRPCHP